MTMDVLLGNNFVNTYQPFCQYDEYIALNTLDNKTCLCEKERKALALAYEDFMNQHKKQNRGEVNKKIEKLLPTNILVLEEPLEKRKTEQPKTSFKFQKELKNTLETLEDWDRLLEKEIFLDKNPYLLEIKEHNSKTEKYLEEVEEQLEKACSENPAAFGCRAELS